MGGEKYTRASLSQLGCVKGGWWVLFGDCISGQDRGSAIGEEVEIAARDTFVLFRVNPLVWVCVWGLW